MAHSHCVLNTYGYKDMLRIDNIYCFSTATIVAQTHLVVTLYLHSLPCHGANFGFVLSTSIIQ